MALDLPSNENQQGPGVAYPSARHLTTQRLKRLRGLAPLLNGGLLKTRLTRPAQRRTLTAEHILVELARRQQRAGLETVGEEGAPAKLQGTMPCSMLFSVSCIC